MRILVIGLGGIGSALIEPLARFTQYSLGDGEIILIDGDSYEEKNLARQRVNKEELRKNKAEVHAERLCTLFEKLKISAFPKYINQDNVRQFVVEGSIVISCVDNHRTRKIIQDACMGLDNITMISGGNELHDGKVQVFMKKNKRMVCPPITKFHDEIEYPADKSPEEMSCEELLESKPQLLFTNFMVASLILNAFYLYAENKTPEYREVYFDIIQNAARPAKKGGG